MEAPGTHSGSWALPRDRLRPVTVDCPSHWPTNEMLLTGLLPDSAENYWRTFGSNKKSIQVSCLLKGQGECKSSLSFLRGGHGMYLEKEYFHFFFSFVGRFLNVLTFFFLSSEKFSHFVSAFHSYAANFWLLDKFNCAFPQLHTGRKLLTVFII